MHIGLFHTKTGAFSVSVQQRSEKSWHPAIHTQGHLVTTATTIIILYQMPTGAWPGVMEMKRSPPKDTEAQRDYCQRSLRGGNKRKVWRREREGEWEGDEKREKEDEKSRSSRSTARRSGLKRIPDTARFSHCCIMPAHRPSPASHSGEGQGVGPAGK